MNEQPVYRIKDWDDNFENNRTRDMVKMAWVPVPNKHDGEGYKRIMQEKDGIQIYGCWHLILQVASKCKTRGTLLRDDRTPITAESIAIKSGWPHPDQFQRAIDFLATPEVGWIEMVTQNGKQIPHEPAANPQLPARKGRERKERKEGNKAAAQSNRVSENTPLMNTIGAWFGRRPTTLWLKDEAKRLESVNPTEEDVGLMAQYYEAKIPQKEDFRRRSIETLLNNWQGELDRAAFFLKSKPEKPDPDAWRNVPIKPMNQDHLKR